MADQVYRFEPDLCANEPSLMVVSGPPKMPRAPSICSFIANGWESKTLNQPGSFCYFFPAVDVAFFVPGATG
jgi:hypothetical protein